MTRWIPGPREGWLYLLLLVAVVLSPALSLADAEWVDDLSIVPWLALFSILLGTVLAKLPVRWPVAHLFSASIGLGLIVTYFAGLGPRGDLEARLLWLWDRIELWLRAAFGGGMSNDSMLFALLMALTAWLMGYLAAWFAFRVHNVWLPVVAAGSGLLVNLSYGDPNGLQHFLLFLMASLLLLARLTLFQKERDWHRADAEYNRGLSRNSLWGSALLSAGILAFAWILPTGTVNASVAENWYNVTGPWHGLQTEFDRLFASVGASSAKVEGNRFARTLALKGAIELGTDPVMLVASPVAEYWATQSYDRYTGHGWMSSSEQTTRLDPNDARLAETSLYRGRADVEQRFKLLVGRTTSVFAASTPVKLSIPVYADHFGTLDELAALRSTIPMRQGLQYGVISSVSVASASLLRKAGTDYPDDVARYLELPGNLRTRQNPLARVATSARQVVRNADNPYDAAIALQDHLRGLRYQIKVASPPPDRDAVDWFLFTAREGYCDYFASAMAVMARTLGIPARVVSGYNSGTYDQEAGVFQVGQENAHSWPELFFPGYGWVRFEPTPSQPPPDRPEKSPEESSAGSALDEADLEALSLGLTGRDQLLLDDEYDMMGGGYFGLGVSLEDPLEWSRVALPAALLMALLLLAGALRLLFSRLSPAARSYLQMSWTAGLLGSRQEAFQTPGEYGRLLGDTWPGLRPEVETVVGAYVEETYGRRRPTEEEAAERSWRRMRPELPRQWLKRAISR